MIHERLKEIRIKLGYTPEAFRKALGIKNQPTYFRYENGDRKLPDEFIIKLFDTFDVNLNYLYTGKGSMFILKNSNEK